MCRVLVVDDDESILRLIKKALEQSDIEVSVLKELEFIDLSNFIGYDLILLDIMMPIDGIEICKAIRNQINVPILFITSKQLDEDFVAGVKAGADDYIKKPFSVVELVARVKMHLNREKRANKDTKFLDYGCLRIDFSRQELSVGGELVPLTRREYALLYLLAKNPDKVFSIEEIYEWVYPTDSNTQFRSVSEYVYQIRMKLKPYSINPIKTQWGGGYRWNSN